MAQFCHRCGVEMPDSARFCAGCGTASVASGVAAGRPLLRPRTGRQLGGVCAALSNSYGWDLTLVRILCVVGAIFTSGLVLVAYVACWIGIPEEPLTPPGVYPPAV